MIRKVARKKVFFGFDFQRLQFGLETNYFAPLPDDFVYQVTFWQSGLPVSIRFRGYFELKISLNQGRWIICTDVIAQVSFKFDLNKFLDEKNRIFSS